MNAVQLPDAPEMGAQLLRAPSVSSADKRLETGMDVVKGPGDILCAHPPDEFIRRDRPPAATRDITALIGEFRGDGSPRAA